MIGRQLVQALARRPPPVPLNRWPLQPGPQVQPQRGLRRPCGCDCDVTVFGHVCCPDALPDLRET